MSKNDKHEKTGESVTRNSNGLKRRDLLLSGSSLMAASTLLRGITTAAQAQQPAPAASGGQRPNIVIIWGDDIGLVRCQRLFAGLMGFRPPTSTGSPTKA